jgi:hypothetical protein
MIVTTSNILALAKQGNVYSDTPVYDKSGKYRMLTTPVTYQLSDGRLLKVDKGFIWDENSVPWLFQPLFPKSGVYAPAAIPHDALYYLTATSKRFADNEFVLWMLALDIDPSQIRWRWFAVDKFGWKWWNRNVHKPGERCLYNRQLITLE